MENTGKFMNAESVEEIRKEKMERAEEKAIMCRQAAARRYANWIALVAADAGLVYMLFNNLIDLKIGIVFLAVASAWIARKTV